MADNATGFVSGGTATCSTPEVPGRIRRMDSYTLAYVLFGGTAPFVATGLVAGFGTPLPPLNDPWRQHFAAFAFRLMKSGPLGSISAE